MSGSPGGLGVVVIARNEGERLLACLDSLRGAAAHIVYADSASTDGSPERARERGAEVVVLGAERPLNAARGRNAGFARLQELAPELEHVFFVDGDCTVVPGFLAAARAELERESDLGAVCGRRRELHPEHSPLPLARLHWTPEPPAASLLRPLHLHQERQDCQGCPGGGSCSAQELHRETHP